MHSKVHVRFGGGSSQVHTDLVLLPYAFSGEVKLARKHTRFILRDLPNLVQGAVGKLMERWHHQDERIGSYKIAELEDCTAHDLVIRGLDVGVCCNRHIPQVLHEWRQPRHEEFQPRNVWSLFNAFTETLKGNLRAAKAHRGAAWVVR